MKLYYSFPEKNVFRGGFHECFAYEAALSRVKGGVMKMTQQMWDAYQQRLGYTDEEMKASFISASLNGGGCGRMAENSKRTLDERAL